MSHSSIIHVSQTFLNAGSGSPGFSHGLNWALATKGVTEFPFMLGPGSLLGRASEFSKPQFIYVPSSISQGVVDAVGLGAQGNSGLIAADIECSSHLFYVVKHLLIPVELKKH
ncbi:hypothetical protein NC652_031343 [Populus alba x Populus x berolinensis]|nr:hypothetical protein NC652_031343 [Populus alba x Populus x berolinensis]